MNLPGWAEKLDLAPHPEGGFYRETWRSDVHIGDRCAGTAILFLLLPGQESAWHTVASAELWFHHRGTIALTLGGDADLPGEEIVHLVGPDPQVLVPPGHWQKARPIGDEPALVSCVVVPGFDFRDFRLLDR